MTDAEVATIATRCLEAWTSGDFPTARILLRDDVTTVDPFGATEGAENYLDELRQLAKLVTSADQRQVLVDGENVCVFYDLLTVDAGTVPSTTWYHISDGMIDSVQAYFDTRLIGYHSALYRNEEEASSGFPVFCSAEMEVADWDGPSG
jgi:hypothetical protein